MVKRQKKGFSLVEAMISAAILVIVIVFAVSSTTKKVKEPDPSFRGIYVCKCEDNQARSFYVTNGEIRDKQDDYPSDTCKFYPMPGVNLYTVKVWNVHSSDYYDKENASRTFVVTSFPKREINVKLGNKNDTDISVEGALYVNDLKPRCINRNISEDVCKSNNWLWRDNAWCSGNNAVTQTDCDNAGGNWRIGECVQGDSSKCKESDGFERINFDIDTNCTNGVNVEIMW